MWFRHELKALKEPRNSINNNAPLWLSFAHFAFIAITVIAAHHPVVFIGAFLFFLGLASITTEYQDELKLKESLLVAFFLGGLVVLGGLQSWWLKPLISEVTGPQLYVGAAGITAVLDNAALTFLGTQIPDLPTEYRYLLVAGAISGGGLTVIANAPNPIGFSILQSSFGTEGISPLRLFFSALLPTAIAMCAFYFF